MEEVAALKLAVAEMTEVARMGALVATFGLNPQLVLLVAEILAGQGYDESCIEREIDVDEIMADMARKNVLQDLPTGKIKQTQVALRNFTCTSTSLSRRKSKQTVTMPASSSKRKRSSAERSEREKNLKMCTMACHVLIEVVGVNFGINLWDEVRLVLALAQRMAKMSKELSVDIDDCLSKVRQKCHNVRGKTRKFLKSEKFKEQLVAELKVEVDFRDGKQDWTPEDMDNIYRWGFPSQALELYGTTVTDSAKAAFEADGMTQSRARQVVEILNRHALNVEAVENEEVGVAGVMTKGRKKVVATIGWVNGSSDGCIFLVVPGCDTHNVPEFVAIVRAREGVSIESGMSMVPVRVEFVDAEVAFELCALAADGVGAMAVDTIDWSAVTACPPSARTATWDDAYGAMVGAEVEWPAVGLLFTNLRKISAAAALSARVKLKGV
ncbi:hypothetical protein FOA52_008288 [Chlamydomonas sp. UWO 241]|nr:hypothetical protein FOA52_008288 [Chlamydomonas sp. UWO 241]